MCLYVVLLCVFMLSYYVSLCCPIMCLYVVLLCVFMLSYYVSLCCPIMCLYARSYGICYDFRIKTMFGSSLPPVVFRRAHVLFTLFVFVCA